MKVLTASICLWFHTSLLFGQVAEVAKCGLDDAATLNSYEAQYFNEVFQDKKGAFDFTGKVIAFYTGSSGTTPSTKSHYFNSLKNTTVKAVDLHVWQADGTQLLILTREERALTGGYDAILVSWAKVSKEGKGRIHLVNQLKPPFPITISPALVDTTLAFDQHAHEDEFWHLDTAISPQRNLSVSQLGAPLDPTFKPDAYSHYHFDRLYYYRSLPPLNKKVQVELYKAKSVVMSNVSVYYVFLVTRNTQNQQVIDHQVLLMNGNPIDLREYSTGAIIHSYVDIKTVTYVDYFDRTAITRRLHIQKSGRIEVVSTAVQQLGSYTH